MSGIRPAPPEDRAAIELRELWAAAGAARDARERAENRRAVVALCCAALALALALVIYAVARLVLQ